MLEKTDHLDWLMKSPCLKEKVNFRPGGGLKSTKHRRKHPLGGGRWGKTISRGAKLSPAKKFTVTVH